MREVLVGTKEVAELLGVTRQRVNKIAHTHAQFPRPVGQLAAGRIWKRRDIVRWAKKSRREVPHVSKA
jgi:prophage regulatory protein